MPSCIDIPALVITLSCLMVATRAGIFTFEDFKTTIEREISSAFGEDKKVGFGS